MGKEGIWHFQWGYGNPFFRNGPTCFSFLPAFSDARHKRAVRSLACRFNQHPISLYVGLQFPVRLLHPTLIFQANKTKHCQLQVWSLPHSKKGSTGNSSCFNLKFRRSCWCWRMPGSRFSLKSYLYKNTCKHKAEAWGHLYDSLFSWAFQPSPTALRERGSS